MPPHLWIKRIPEARLQIQLHNAKQLKGLQKPSKYRASDCMHDVFLLKALPYRGRSEFQESKGGGKHTSSQGSHSGAC